MINESGDIYSAKNLSSRYGGSARGPSPDAAFHHSVASPIMSSTIAANATGQDGQLWIIVN